MTLESSKKLGVVGAILLFVAAIAFFFQPLLSIIGLVGVIFILVSLNGLADYYKERGIFSNALYAILALIVGVILTVVGLVYLFFYTSYLTDLVKVIYPGFNGDWSNLQNLTPNTNPNPNDLVPFVGPILSVLAIMWVFLIIASFFVWRSLKRIASQSNVGLFSTAGLILLIGAIIPVAGLILMWIAVLVIAIAFFQIKPQTPQPINAAPYSSQPPTTV